MSRPTVAKSARPSVNLERSQALIRGLLKEAEQSAEITQFVSLNQVVVSATCHQLYEILHGELQTAPTASLYSKAARKQPASRQQLITELTLHWKNWGIIENRQIQNKVISFQFIELTLSSIPDNAPSWELVLAEKEREFKATQTKTTHLHAPKTSEQHHSQISSWDALHQFVQTLPIEKVTLTVVLTSPEATTPHSIVIAPSLNSGMLAKHLKLLLAQAKGSRTALVQSVKQTEPAAYKTSGERAAESVADYS